MGIMWEFSEKMVQFLAEKVVLFSPGLPFYPELSIESLQRCRSFSATEADDCEALEKWAASMAEGTWQPFDKLPPTVASEYHGWWFLSPEHHVLEFLASLIVYTPILLFCLKQCAKSLRYQTALQQMEGITIPQPDLLQKVWAVVLLVIATLQIRLKYISLNPASHPAYLLQPCHITTFMMGLITFARPTMLTEALFHVVATTWWGPLLALVAPDLPASSFEVFLFYLQHYLMMGIIWFRVRRSQAFAAAVAAAAPAPAPGASSAASLSSTGAGAGGAPASSDSSQRAVSSAAAPSPSCANRGQCLAGSGGRGASSSWLYVDFSWNLLAFITLACYHWWVVCPVALCTSINVATMLVPPDSLACFGIYYRIVWGLACCPLLHSFAVLVILLVAKVTMTLTLRWKNQEIKVSVEESNVTVQGPKVGGNVLLEKLEKYKQL